MSTLFKDIYSEDFYNKFSEVLKHVISDFDEIKFKELIFNEKFNDYELKERMKHTARVLHYFLSDNFQEATLTIKKIIDNLIIKNIKEESVEFMFFPEYISMYGIEDYDNSIIAFEFITQYTSCEFAVRPYIIKYENKMLKQMTLWSKHSHHMVRRLASEGSRPRLPWAMALPNLKRDPTPILPILNNLKDDETEIVRRSVANNLNDISKDNPSVVIEISNQWINKSKERNSLVKHACRTLLKEANSEILTLFGFDTTNIHLDNFSIITPSLKIGEKLEFSFNILNSSEKDRKIRIEYGVYYKKKNGTLSKKVFKISEREIHKNSSIEINRQQSFKLITTRKFYVGTHQLSIILNGKESHRLNFCLNDIKMEYK